MSINAQSVEHSRAGFLALRGELHARCEDRDLAEVWQGLERSERRTVLRAASIVTTSDSQEHIDNLMTMPLLDMSREARIAIRSAITRMSSFASRLQDGCRKHSAPRHASLAVLAQAAISKGKPAVAARLLRWIEECAS